MIAAENIKPNGLLRAIRKKAFAFEYVRRSRTLRNQKFAYDSTCKVGIVYRIYTKPGGTAGVINPVPALWDGIFLFSPVSYKKLKL